ncbi:hypothetical protein LQ327_24730 [Actinomycetospora endophytica]|uniref:DUF4190 domain-containing protein n=1 Tax=Actinomycetospora endophytica TaxID=2291215 RepID=A0ABS8PE75_9PSEU|nr:hypothetical protein [Actinomycetospora endophytica]MCD2196583.1 hypothetical protein [Actinomycetospora endophytica]
MTGETNEGARRVRVVPRQGPGAPPAGPPTAAPPLEAETDVLPRVAPAPPGPARTPPPGPPPGPPAPRGRPGHAAGPPPPSTQGPAAPTPQAPTPPAVPTPGADEEAAAVADAERRGRAKPDDAGTADGTERRNGMGIPALVLGLLAAGTCWTGWAGVVLGLFGVAAGYLGARRAWNGLATDGGSSLGGLTLGAVGLVVGVVVVWPTLFGTGNFGDGLTLDQCLQQANGAFEMHMCKSQHITEFNQRFPNAAT